MAHIRTLVLEAKSFTFKTFAIAFGGLDGYIGLLKGPLGSSNCGYHRHTIKIGMSTYRALYYIIAFAIIFSAVKFGWLKFDKYIVIQQIC